jgi:hypothetical protein
MAFSGPERRKHARSTQPPGTVSRYAQQRVDMRVMEIMSRRDAAERRDSRSNHAFARPVTPRS